MPPPRLTIDCHCGHAPLSDPNPACERCRLVWTIGKVAELREAQRAFFQRRRQKDLERSKHLERIVDRALERLFARQPDLFPDD